MYVVNPRRFKRATLLEDYRIPFRNIAEASWGRGGTSSTRTTRTGFHYYSCSGHGGYVVDGRRLLPSEKEELDAHGFEPEILQVLVQSVTASSPKYVIGVNMNAFYRYGGRGIRKSWKYDTSKGEANWHEIPVYLFEEDCDWSLIERISGVRLLPFPERVWPKELTGRTVEDNVESHEAAIEESYQQWHAHKRIAAVRWREEDEGPVVENPKRYI